MPANSGAFSDIFSFSRARTAHYRDYAGALKVAAVDQPRLDHDAFGGPLGLLIEGRPDTDKVDTARLKPEVTALDVPLGTLLHDYTPAGGQRRLVAVFTTTPEATLNARLAIRGHHRRIMFFPEFLARDTGQPGWPVIYAGEVWHAGQPLQPAPGYLLATGYPSQPVLIEA